MFDKNNKTPGEEQRHPTNYGGVKHPLGGEYPAKRGFEIFYQVEFTDMLIVAMTDLDTIAIWKRVSQQMLYCQFYPVLSFTECQA